MQVDNFVEKDDGSATFSIDLTAAEISFLVNYAINDIFIRKLKEQEDE